MRWLRPRGIAALGGCGFQRPAPEIETKLFACGMSTTLRRRMDVRQHEHISLTRAQLRDDPSGAKARARVDHRAPNAVDVRRKDRGLERDDVIGELVQN